MLRLFQLIRVFLTYQSIYLDTESRFVHFIANYMLPAILLKKKLTTKLIFYRFLKLVHCLMLYPLISKPEGYHVYHPITNAYWECLLNSTTFRYNSYEFPLLLSHILFQILKKALPLFKIMLFFFICKQLMYKILDRWFVFYNLNNGFCGYSKFFDKYLYFKLFAPVNWKM